MQVCPPGLHIMLGIFTKMFHLLEALCCQLDLELARQTTDFDSSSFSKYSQALQRLSVLQAELENTQHSQEVLQQVATYVALVHGEKNPLAVDLLKQSAEKKKSVKALVCNDPTQFLLKFMSTIGSRSGQMHSTCEKRVF